MHQCFFFRRIDKMSHAALAAVRVSSSQLFLVHHFIGHGLHHIRSGDEHVAVFVDHENKVGEGGRVAGTSGTWAEDGRELGNHAGGHRILVEYGSVSRQAGDAFLYAGASRIVQPDDGCAALQGQSLHFYDFGCVGLAQRTAVYGEVVSVNEHLPSVYLAVTAHHAVSRNLFLVHSEAGATVVHEFVYFAERVFVEQHVDAFACRHAARGVLLFYLVRSATLRSPFVQFLKPGI